MDFVVRILMNFVLLVVVVVNDDGENAVQRHQKNIEKEWKL